MLHRLPAALAAVCLLAVATSAGAQPGAGATALRQGFRDEDLAWILPLFDAQAADAQRDSVRGDAAVAALQQQIALAGGRADRVASGSEDPMALLRRTAPDLALPPGAVYDARCSAAVTADIGGLDVRALFTLGEPVDPALADLALKAAASTDRQTQAFGGLAVSHNLGQQPAFRRALAWYKENGRSGERWTVLNDGGYMQVRLPEDGPWVHMWGYNPFGGKPACAHLPTGPTIMVEGRQGMDRAIDAAADAAVAGSEARLPARLRAAGLTESQWGDVQVAIALAQMDADIERQSPDALTLMLADVPAADAARRRANAAWYRRHAGELERRLKGPME